MSKADDLRRLIENPPHETRTSMIVAWPNGESVFTIQDLRNVIIQECIEAVQVSEALAGLSPDQ